MRFSQSRGNQFLQPNRCRRVSTRQFSHERNARTFNSLSQLQRFGRSHVQRGRTKDGLACVTGRQNRQRSVPFRGQSQHDIDILSLHNGSESTGGVRIELFGNRDGSFGHLAADGANLEPVRQRAQRRQVASLPLIAKPNDSHTQFHPRFLCQSEWSLSAVRTKSVSHPTNRAESVASAAGRESVQRFI